MNGRSATVEITGIALSPEFVYTIGPGALMPDAKRYGVLWMNERELAAAFDLDGAFDDVTLTLLPGASDRVVIEALDSCSSRMAAPVRIARRDQLSNWFVKNEIKQLETMARILPSVFLAVAAFLTNVDADAARLDRTRRDRPAQSLRLYGRRRRLALRETRRSR